VTGSGTAIDGGLLLYTHAGAGGNPEARLRLGAKIAHVHTKDTGGTFRERLLVDTAQSRLSSPDTADYVRVQDTGIQAYVNNAERVRVDDDESLIYTPNQLDYLWLKDNDVVMSRPPRFPSVAYPISRRSRDTDQSIPNDNVNFTRVTWNVNIDNASITYSSGVFTCPQAGYYLVVANILWAAASSGSGRRLLEIRVNGSTQARATAPGNATAFSQNLATPVYVPAGGTVDIWALQNSGSALVINGSAATPEYTWVKLLLEAAV
jgi:hypothetical protein